METPDRRTAAGQAGRREAERRAKAAERRASTDNNGSSGGSSGLSGPVTACGDGVYAGSATSCSFAMNVAGGTAATPAHDHHGLQPSNGDAVHLVDTSSWSGGGHVLCTAATTRRSICPDAGEGPQLGRSRPWLRYGASRLLTLRPMGATRYSPAAELCRGECRRRRYRWARLRSGPTAGSVSTCRGEVRATSRPASIMWATRLLTPRPMGGTGRRRPWLRYGAARLLTRGRSAGTQTEGGLGFDTALRARHPARPPHWLGRRNEKRHEAHAEKFLLGGNRRSTRDPTPGVVGPCSSASGRTGDHLSRHPPRPDRCRRPWLTDLPTGRRS